MNEKKVFLSNEDNLILQSIATFDLLCALQKDNFFDTEYGQNLLANRIDEYLQEPLKKTGLINTGVIVSSLYSLLVLPKEFGTQNFDKINEYINKLVAERKATACTTYRSDQTTIQHICHIRNAVAHGRVTFIGEELPNTYVTSDESDKRRAVRRHGDR